MRNPMRGACKNADPKLQRAQLIANCAILVPLRFYLSESVPRMDPHEPARGGINVDVQPLVCLHRKGVLTWLTT